MVTDEQWDEYEGQAKTLGQEHGRSAATWVDLDSEEKCLWWRKGINDGDPEVMDCFPSPLSGEHADDMTPQKLYAAVGLGDVAALDELLVDPLSEVYEAAFADAFQAEVERRIADALGEERVIDVD